MGIKTAERHQLVQTVTSPGWAVVLQAGEEVVKSYQEASAEFPEDEATALRLLRQARFAREFWNLLQSHIKAEAHYEPDPVFTPTESY